VTLSCPRCGVVVRSPGIWSDAWTCPYHGGVAPLHPPMLGTFEALQQTGQRSQVPLWLPWPLPPDWLVSGLRVAGDEHTGPVAVVMACSGPNPLAAGQDQPRSADLLLVAEQPGVGLAAHLAGLTDVDPGTAVGLGSPNLKLLAGGQHTPLWAIDVDGLAAYVGEASGVWLWALVWPQTAAAVLLEQFELRDARDLGLLLELPPHGALSPRLG
jgi:hypothetical protein